MHARGPLVRFLLGLGLACAAVVAVVGGIALRAPGLVAVCVSGALAGFVAAGVARETAGPDRRSPVEAGVQAGAVAIGALLVVSGTAVLAGGVAALLMAGALAAGWAGLRWLADRRVAASTARPAWPAEAPARSTPGPAVGGLPTTALVEEWLRTGAQLGGPLAPAARQRVVLRRAQVLDELERRDPAGFARWLAAGPLHAGDPAGFLRSEPPRAAPGTEAEAA
ncbi:hypothetical protein [Blastococcus xanthinilyticus]|uniref:Uncharacterized protein n=1 Tax=Blastococcus xanthinilyticus TaxID=1564164 RepID=A0A5S5CPA4_9ACTN|nr:hypothetical protein [Blastococcus xanthinilyticus]TYP84824.1 hypothetical protein BD833_11385 [Blastococcus xanthinilyticus]